MKAGQKRSLLNQHSILLQVTTLQVQDGICGPSLLFTNDSQNGCVVACHCHCQLVHKINDLDASALQY